ncbi:hypothetical protein [Larkinella soli]|uniref:hypothetical protein n=1 Tax=Larkinella soli TaxID=1770527 RepID=UPI000FFC24A6|nr:hypothetical protein [Larkinella soli]
MEAPTEKDTIQTEIAAFEEMPDWDSMKKAIRFRHDSEGNSTQSTIPRQGCCAMSYDRLKEKYGINLEGRRSRNNA